jgi:CRP-like cAMP-binding protein
MSQGTWSSPKGARRALLLIADGRVRLCRDGEQLSEMGPDDSFGKIALLRRIPRTATVTATRLQVRSRAQEEFPAAVTSNPESIQSADEVASTRLTVGQPRYRLLKAFGPVADPSRRAGAGC